MVNRGILNRLIEIRQSFVEQAADEQIIQQKKKLFACDLYM